MPPTALQTIPITWTFAVWGLDMVGPLKGGTHKKKYLLVMVDKFTKWIEAKPIKMAESGPVIDFISGVVHHYGVPHSIITDNGTNFTANEVKLWCKNMGIKLDYASVYHPQTNGQVERANGLIMSGIKPRLVRSLKESNTHWVEELDSVLWGLRTTPNRTTGYTPFFMVYGAEAVLPCEIIHDSPCACTKKEKPSLIGRTVWTPWRRSVMWQKPAPHSITNRLNGIKAEKYGPKLITLANSFYAYQRRKRTSSSPNGKVPSLLTKFSLVERTVYGMHRTI